MTASDHLLAAVDRLPGLAPGLRCLALLHGAAVAGRFEAVDDLAVLALARGETPERLLEAALQVVPYGGFPRAIEALDRVASRLDGTGTASAEDARDTAERFADGRHTFQLVYERNAESVLARLDERLPGFSALVIDQAYGRILSRGVLTLGERELLAVAALALSSLPSPLASHIRGALRNGFAPPAVQDILQSCIPLAGSQASPVITQALDRLSRKVYRP